MPVDLVGPHVVACLNECWHAIRVQHREVPAVRISASGNWLPLQQQTCGPLAAARWQDGKGLPSELFITTAGLRRNSLAILVTLLHHAAHGIARKRGIADTRTHGRYHDVGFRELAESVGLRCRYNRATGWSATDAGPGIADQYAAQLTEIERALTAEPIHRTSIAVRRGLLAATCSCPRRIRASTSVLEIGEIRCGLCGDEFVPVK